MNIAKEYWMPIDKTIFMKKTIDIENLTGKDLVNLIKAYHLENDSATGCITFNKNDSTNNISKTIEIKAHQDYFKKFE